MKKIAAIILAAGRSSRLGRPKQLVPFKGKTLLRNAVQSAIFSPVESVTVVLGAFYPLMRREIRWLDVDIVKNRSWISGMGSSLKVGLNHVIANELVPYDGFLFMTCDQPFVDESLLSTMCGKFEYPNQIVASLYSSDIGVPVIFGRDYLAELLEIDDEAGARQILQASNKNLIQIPFTGGEFDIDTAGDMKRLREFNHWWKNGKNRGQNDDFIPAQ